MRWTLLAAIFGGVGVALGAFGAHALKGRLSPEDLAVFDTAVRYQFIHALALIGCDVIGLWLAAANPGSSGDSSTALRVAGWCFVGGIAVFSGSLYALVATGIRKLGMVTPIGGVAFIVGWVALGIAAWQARSGP